MTDELRVLNVPASTTAKHSFLLLFKDILHSSCLLPFVALSFTGELKTTTEIYVTRCGRKSSAHSLTCSPHRKKNIHTSGVSFVERKAEFLRASGGGVENLNGNWIPVNAKRRQKKIFFFVEVRSIFASCKLSLFSRKCSLELIT